MCVVPLYICNYEVTVIPARSGIEHYDDLAPFFSVSGLSVTLPQNFLLVWILMCIGKLTKHRICWTESDIMCAEIGTQLFLATRHVNPVMSVPCPVRTIGTHK
jgi:hypothetical protein